MTTRHAADIDLTIGMYPDDYDLTRIQTRPASKAAVEAIMKADERSLDGRSNWLWFRLPNGDLLFGCFPEGDTYSLWENEYP